MRVRVPPAAAAVHVAHAVVAGFFCLIGMASVAEGGSAQTTSTIERDRADAAVRRHWEEVLKSSIRRSATTPLAYSYEPVERRLPSGVLVRIESDDLLKCDGHPTNRPNSRSPGEACSRVGVVWLALGESIWVSYLEKACAVGSEGDYDAAAACVDLADMWAGDPQRQLGWRALLSFTPACRGQDICTGAHSLLSQRARQSVFTTPGQPSPPPLTPPQSVNPSLDETMGYIRQYMSRTAVRFGSDGRETNFAYGRLEGCILTLHQRVTETRVAGSPPGSYDYYTEHVIPLYDLDADAISRDRAHEYVDLATRDGRKTIRVRNVPIGQYATSNGTTYFNSVLIQFRDTDTAGRARRAFAYAARLCFAQAPRDTDPFRNH